MRPDGPLISVIIPTYDCARYLPDALASVRRQNYEPIEIVIVDDGSTDETADVVGTLGGQIVFLQQANAGAAVARNTGLAVAQGSIIAFLDADDVWPDDMFAHQLPVLLNDDALGVVQGRSQVEIIDPSASDENVTRFKPFGEAWYAPLLGSGLFRKWVIDRVGGFDAEFRLGHDMDWFLRVREQGVPGVLIPQVTLLYRLHDTNATRGADPKTRDILLVLRRSLQRRREASAGDATPVASWAPREKAHHE